MGAFESSFPRRYHLYTDQPLHLVKPPSPYTILVNRRVKQLLTTFLPPALSSSDVRGIVCLFSRLDDATCVCNIDVIATKRQRNQSQWLWCGILILNTQRPAIGCVPSTNIIFLSQNYHILKPIAPNTEPKLGIFVLI